MIRSQNDRAEVGNTVGRDVQLPAGRGDRLGTCPLSQSGQCRWGESGDNRLYGGSPHRRTPKSGVARRILACVIPRVDK